MNDQHSQPQQRVNSGDQPLDVVLPETSFPETSDGAELLGRPTGLGCFKCSGELEIANVAAFKIAACRECHGLLVQTRHLGGLINVLRAAYKELDAEPKPMPQDHLHQNTDCNACGNRMDTHPYMGPGNIVIDSCHHCKMIWLDGDELNRVVRAPGRRDFAPDELTGFDPGEAISRQTKDADDPALAAALALAWLIN